MDALGLEAVEEALAHQVDTLGGRQLLVPESSVLFLGFGPRHDADGPRAPPPVLDSTALDRAAHDDSLPREVVAIWSKRELPKV
jgi:hypothetical protein